MINLLDETKLKVSDIVVKNTISIGQPSENIAQGESFFQLSEKEQQVEGLEIKQQEQKKDNIKNPKKSKRQTKNDKQENKKQQTINSSMKSKELQINLLFDRQKKIEFVIDIHKTLSELSLLQYMRMMRVKSLFMKFLRKPIKVLTQLLIKSVPTEKQFIQKLPNFDQAWILSSWKIKSKQDKLVNAVRKHLDQRKGLMLWASKEPLIAHSNLILKSLDDPILSQIQLEGSDYGMKTLLRTNSETPTKQSFISHQITTGLFKQNQGDTICQLVLNEQPPPSYKIIGVGSTGRPCYVCIEETRKRGRIIIDCAMTKLWTNRNWRYVRNCAVWLLGLDSEI